MDDELDRLMDQREVARQELQAHITIGVAAWWGDRLPDRKHEPITPEWWKRYKELRDLSSHADAALEDYIRRRAGMTR